MILLLAIRMLLLAFLMLLLAIRMLLLAFLMLLLAIRMLLLAFLILLLLRTIRLGIVHEVGSGRRSVRHDHSVLVVLMQGSVWSSKSGTEKWIRLQLLE